MSETPNLPSPYWTKTDTWISKGCKWILEFSPPTEYFPLCYTVYDVDMTFKGHGRSVAGALDDFIEQCTKQKESLDRLILRAVEMKALEQNAKRVEAIGEVLGDKQDKENGK